MQHDLVIGDLERHAPAELVDRLLELLVGERHEPPAAVADEMVVVAVLAAARLVAHHALAGLDSLHELEALELVQDPVDAGARHAAVGVAQGVLDVERRQRAMLAVEQLEHALRAAPRR